MSSEAIAIPGSSSRASGSGSSRSTPSSPNSPSSSSSTPGSPMTPSAPWQHSRRRPSLLSSSVSKAEHTSYDMGTRDGSPRIITYVKTSQGFDWNQDIFLPSSSDITIHNGINQPERVHEIILTDDDHFLPS